MLTLRLVALGCLMVVLVAGAAFAIGRTARPDAPQPIAVESITNGRVAVIKLPASSGDLPAMRSATTTRRARSTGSGTTATTRGTAPAATREPTPPATKVTTSKPACSTRR